MWLWGKRARTDKGFPDDNSLTVGETKATLDLAAKMVENNEALHATKAAAMAMTEVYDKLLGSRRAEAGRLLAPVAAALDGC